MCPCAVSWVQRKRGFKTHKKVLYAISRATKTAINNRTPFKPVRISQIAFDLVKNLLDPPSNFSGGSSLVSNGQTRCTPGEVYDDDGKCGGR